MYIPSPYRDKLYLLNLDLQQEEELEWQTNNSLYNEPSTSTNCQDPLSDVSILSCSSSFFLPLSFLFFQSLSSPATLPSSPSISSSTFPSHFLPSIGAVDAHYGHDPMPISNLEVVVSTHSRLSGEASIKTDDYLCCSAVHVHKVVGCA